MKQILILLILTSFALHLRAQQMISVIDDDTHDPIGNALFILDGDTIAYTSPQGIAPVIRLKSEIKKLDEVFVFGKMGLRDKFTDKSGYDRIQGKYAGAGGDLGAIFRIFGYRPASERRRERVKKNLEAFDKAEPAPQPNDK